jgi:hypothetical protein
MARFAPPAQIDDFIRSTKADELAAGWDAVVDSWLTDVATPGGAFYNPHAAGAPTGGTEAPIAWDAFPLTIKQWFDAELGGDDKKYRCADTLRPVRRGGRRLRAVRNGRLAEELDVFHRQQDEYCEWFVERTDGAITGIQFTSEGPEYWEFLMSGTRPFFPPGDPRRAITDGDPELVLALYREHVDARVQLEDLVWQHDVASWDAADQVWRRHASAGDYNRLNRWNTTDGAMHLTHPSNTLQAEVRLAADGTVLRNAPANARAMICCAGYGSASRSSDPLIGFAVNQAVAAGNAVTLADPIGLYVAGINTAALSDPTAWRAVRQSPTGDRILRGRIDAPAGGLQVGGSPLRWGGQVADHIQMVLTGLLTPLAGPRPPRQDCGSRCCHHPDRPEFVVVVAAGDECDSVPWPQQAPFLPDPAAPGPAAAPLPPGRDQGEPVTLAPAQRSTAHR